MQRRAGNDSPPPSVSSEPPFVSAILHRPALAAVLFVLCVVGCRRTADLQFSVATEVDELPARHQQNIEDGLLRLFGTLPNPRLRLEDPDATEEEEEETDEDEDVEEAEDGDAAEAEEGATVYGAEFALMEVADPRHLAAGAEIYNSRCAGCHGVSGDGAGEAAEYLVPRPRDYRNGVYKFTSTPYGSKPARHDLVRTIRRGAKGTSMPAFPWMSDEDLDAVIDYVIYLSKRGRGRTLCGDHRRRLRGRRRS